jgi:hypothetical protein
MRAAAAVKESSKKMRHKEDSFTQLAEIAPRYEAASKVFR